MAFGLYRGTRLPNPYKPTWSLCRKCARSPRRAPAPHLKKRSGDAEKKRGARPLKSVGCLAESVSSRYSNLRWITSDLDRVHAALGGTSAQRPAIQNLRLPPSRRATVASSPLDAALKQRPGRRGGGALRIRSAAWVKISPGHCENAQVRKCDTRSMDLMLRGAHCFLLGTQAGSGPTGRVPLPVFDAGLSRTRKKDKQIATRTAPLPTPLGWSARGRSCVHVQQVALTACFPGCGRAVCLHRLAN